MALPNEFERKLITQLRSSCRDVTKEMDSDPGDMFFVRWLRAQDYNMKRAEQMLRDNTRWKRQHKVNRIFDSGLDTFLKSNYPLHLGIIDKRSRPVVILPIGRWNLRQAVSNGLYPGFRTYVIQCMEAVMKNVENRDALRKTCAMPITQFTAILDFEGFQSSQLLDIRGNTEIAKLDSLGGTHVDTVVFTQGCPFWCYASQFQRKATYSIQFVALASEATRIFLRAIHQTLSTLRSNYPKTVASCLCINCPVVVAKSIQFLMAPVTSSKSSSSVLHGNSMIWCGRMEDDVEMRRVLLKFVPQEELEKCVYLLRAD